MRSKVETIWMEHYKELERFIFSRLKDTDITNDVLQDVFLKLHGKIDTLKNEEKIKPWLYRVTRNTIADHFREQKFSANTDTMASESEINANERFAGCVQPHINKLPDIYKEALIKTEFQNYSQLQLAEELNISYSGAKSRVQRAKELLKGYFKQCCNISNDKYGNILNFDVKKDCKLC